MCGRFAISSNPQEIEERFELTNKLFDFRPSYNVSPSQTIPVVTKNSPKKGILMKWGFIPHWADPKNLKLKPINARDDKLSSPFFRESFKSMRCLIPTTGYYEWAKLNLDGKIEKQPYYFTLKNGGLFSLGGIYSVKEDAEKVKHYFFAIITTKANSLQGKIHNRMPLIIPNGDEDNWLETANPKPLVKPYKSFGMVSWRVSTQINSPRSEGETLIKKSN